MAAQSTETVRSILIEIRNKQQELETELAALREEVRAMKSTVGDSQQTLLTVQNSLG